MEEMQKRKFWQDLIHCLQREMRFQRQESFSEPERNMCSRCFKEFDLQLFLSFGKAKGVGQWVQERVSHVFWLLVLEP